MNRELYRIFFEIQKKHWWFVTRKEIVLDMIGRYQVKKKTANVLDIGCGAGVMLNALEQVGRVYGMDISADAIEFSKEIFDGKVEKGSLPADVPYKDGFFDLITALDVIEHIDHDIESLRSIHSLLAPGGKVVVTVPAYMFLWSSFDEVNEHKRRYTRPELRAKLEQAGFEVEKISYYNTLLFPIVFVVRLLKKILNRAGESDVDMPSSFINFVLKKIFGLEKYLLRYANLPFGVSVLAVARR